MTPPGRNPADGILMSGSVVVYRNHAGKRFGEADSFVFNESWTDTAGIGAAIRRAVAKADRTERSHPFAWSGDFGYLSPVPSHCGLGVEVVAEMHLEGLSLMNYIQPAFRGLTAMRLSAAGIWREEIHDIASFYCIRTTGSFGIGQDEFAERVSDALAFVVKCERDMRTELLKGSPRLFCDAVMRALGVLRHARYISPWEFVDLLSPLGLAAEEDLLEGLDSEEIKTLTRYWMDRADETFPDSDEGDRRRRERDADLADYLNGRFANVSLSRRGKEILDEF